MDNINYEYAEDELLTYSIIVLKKIADKYDINNNKNRQSLITDILQHQNELYVLKSKNNKQNISQQIKNDINTLPADAIRLLALNLSYSEIIKLCRSLKRFNNEICRNNIFQKQYGLLHLSSDIKNLPRDKEGNYGVLKELGKLESTKLKKIYIQYLAENNYDKYIIENIKTFDQNNKNDLLQYAAKNGYLELIKYLVEKGANIHGHNYGTPLISAASNGHLEVVKYLVENGANISASGDIALILAASNGHLEMVKYLKENGANIHGQDDEALQFAAQNDHLEIVKYLVENGAPPGAAGILPADIHGNTDGALQKAALYGNLKIVKYLVENGANIDANNDASLIYAAENGHLEVVKYLVENGANIHANDDIALQEAAENGHLEIIKYLIENGANINMLDITRLSDEIKKYIKNVKKY